MAEMDELLNALKDRDPSVREGIASTLGQMKDEKAIPDLINCLSDNDPHVKSSAAIALGNYNNEEVIDALISKLDDGSWFVRADCAASLGRVGKNAVAKILKLLRNENPYVRRGATIALGKIGLKNKKVIDELCNTLDDEVWYVRAGAAASLGSIGDRTVIKDLAGLFTDEDMRVKREACIAMGKIGDESAREYLIRALNDDDNIQVKRFIADALEKTGEEEEIDEDDLLKRIVYLLKKKGIDDATIKDVERLVETEKITNTKELLEVVSQRTKSEATRLMRLQQKLNERLIALTTCVAELQPNEKKKEK